MSKQYSVKACPRCWYGMMRRFERSYWKGWSCSLCHLMISDTGEMHDYDGDIKESDTWNWPLDKEYEALWIEEQKYLK